MAAPVRRKPEVERRSTAADSPRGTAHATDAAQQQAESEQVARRAYELYERRGGEHGHDWDDWFRAEEEIRGQSDTRESAQARNTTDDIVAAT